MAYNTITQLLGEKDGTALVADINGFSNITEGRDPAEVGLFLTSFYIHIADAVAARGGRVVKFLGDGVLAAFFGPGHAAKALGTVADLGRGHEAWLASAKKAGMPPLDFTIAVASGRMLEGEIGTDHVTFYDVIGQPVNLAFRLCALAFKGGAAHVVDETTAAASQIGPPQGDLPTLSEIAIADNDAGGGHVMTRKLLAIEGLGSK